MLALPMLLLACASASNYYVDVQSRYHLEMAPRMGISEGGGRVVAEHYDIDAKISIDVVETTAADIDGYLGEFDATAIGSGDRVDTSVGALAAARLEFRGGIELGKGLATAGNLVLYVIQDGSTIYRLTCTAPDGPFDTFCMGTFDDLVETFGLGPAPAG